MMWIMYPTKDNFQPKHTSHQETGAVLDSKTKTQHVKRKQKVEQLSEVDHALTNTLSSQGESQLYIFEDNEAVIKMINKGRSPTDDTRFQDSQSCSWLVVWQNQFGSQDPNQICWHQKPSRTFWQRKFLKRWLESPSVFVHIVVSRCILVAISKALYLRLESALWLVPCRHEDRTRPRTMAHRRRKQDHWIWWCTVRAVRKSLFTKFGISGQSGEWRWKTRRRTSTRKLDARRL